MRKVAPSVANVIKNSNLLQVALGLSVGYLLSLPVIFTEVVAVALAMPLVAVVVAALCVWSGSLRVLGGLTLITTIGLSWFYHYLSTGFEVF